MISAAHSPQFFLPLGIEDFRELRQSRGYYVDKTSFIKSVMENGNDITVLTRPAGFGKSLTLSTFRHFLELNALTPGDCSVQKQLFAGTAILQEREFCARHMGRYPVIALSFKSVTGASFNEAYCNLVRVIQNVFLEFPYLLESDALLDGEKDELRAVMDAKYLDFTEFNSAKLQCALKHLCSCLKQHFDRKVVILIDDYDVPFISASNGGYAEKMWEIFAGIFMGILKTNCNLKKAMLTGCLPVDGASIHGALYNINPENVLGFDQCDAEGPGFTGDEVATTLGHYGLLSMLSKARRTDGRFNGGKEFFCPRDLITFVTSALQAQNSDAAATGNRGLNLVSNPGSSMLNVQTMFF